MSVFRIRADKTIVGTTSQTGGKIILHVILSRPGISILAGCVSDTHCTWVGCETIYIRP